MWAFSDLLIQYCVLDRTHFASECKRRPVFSGFSNVLEHINVYAMKAVRSNAFSSTSRSGGKLKMFQTPFTPVLVVHL